MRTTAETYSQLYDFQKEGVHFLFGAKEALLADDVGTGKTAQAIHACQQVSAHTILVICTASIKYNWKKEAVKWGYDERDVHILNNKNVQKLPAKGMFIINYDLCWRPNIARVLLKRRFDVLICDEAHSIKNSKTKRAKAVWLRNGYADCARYRWMLTATPVLNRPVELYAMLRHLCPDRLGQYQNYIAYTQRYCEGKPGKWGYDATGADNLDELAKRLEGFMLRRTRDVLPDRQLQKIYMPFSKEIEKYLYTGNENESIRRKIGVGKIEPSAEHIVNILETEQKIVLFAYHTDVIAGLNEKLQEYNPVVLQGETPTKKRQKIIDTFINDPKCRVFIGQIQAAGEGIDGLQRVASIAVFVEIAYTPGIIKQAIGRLYREGQKHKCLFQFLMVEGTIDEHILDTTIMKEKNIQVIMKDKKLGLDFSKQKNTKKEKNMATEKDLLKAVEALENAVELLRKFYTRTPVESCEVSCETPETPETPEPEEPQEAAKLPKVGKKGKVQVDIAPEPEMDEETYQKTIHGFVNRISQSLADPAKTNALFAKLNKTFNEKYPQYAHVFKAEKKDYKDILTMINAFLKAEKVK